MGAKSGHIVTEETRQKMRERKLGKKLSLEHKQNISKAGMGHSVSEETRRKIGMKNSVNLKGKKQSLNTRQKRSITAKERGVGRWMIGKSLPKGFIQQQKSHFGKNNPFWKGGRNKDKDGYILIYKPSHPFANKHGYVREHRLVMEKKVGRFLQPQEVVHHINEIKDDNRPENLMFFNTTGEHIKHHQYLNRMESI